MNMSVILSNEQCKRVSGGDTLLQALTIAVNFYTETAGATDVLDATRRYGDVGKTIGKIIFEMTHSDIR